MKQIKITYDQYITNEYSSGEMYGDWSREYDSPEFKTATFDLGHKDRGRTFGNSYDIVPYVGDDDTKTVYVVYMIYSTGDSFGSSSGDCEVIGAFDDREQAEELMGAIRDNSESFTVHCFDNMYTNPSAGYFECMESLDIEAMIL